MCAAFQSFHPQQAAVLSCAVRMVYRCTPNSGGTLQWRSWSVLRPKPQRNNSADGSSEKWGSEWTRAKSGQRRGVHPSSLSHRTAFGHGGTNEWMHTGQIMSIEAGVLRQSREHFCLWGFCLLSGQTVQSAGGDKTVFTDVRAVFGSFRKSSVFL